MLLLFRVDQVKPHSSKKKYKNLYDIDAFHTEEDIKVLNQLYKETTITITNK